MSVGDRRTLLFDTNLSLTRGFKIDALKETLDFETGSGEIVFEVVD